MYNMCMSRDIHAHKSTGNKIRKQHSQRSHFAISILAIGMYMIASCLCSYHLILLWLLFNLTGRLIVIIAFSYTCIKTVATAVINIDARVNLYKTTHHQLYDLK